MNILITGGGGFIGSNLCRKLISQGHEVTVVDNFITSDESNVLSLKSEPRFEYQVMDINDTKFIRKYAFSKKIDQIYHLACPTGVPNLGPLAEEMLLTCSVGTKNVLDLGLIHGARVLFTSSSEVYGDPEVFPQNEEYTGNVDPLGFRSPYEEGKRFSESLFKMYSKKYHLDIRIVRVFNTYGPFMSWKDTRVIPQFLRKALLNEKLEILGTGLNTRTFCFADDLVNGLIQVMAKGEPASVYNIGGDEEIAVKDLAKLIIKLTKSKSKIDHLKNNFEDHKRRKPSLDKIFNLGWSYNIDLEKGISKTISYYVL